MFTKNINFKNFRIKKFNKEISKDLNLILKEKNKAIESLSTFYKYSYNKKIISKIKKIQRCKSHWYGRLYIRNRSYI